MCSFSHPLTSMRSGEGGHTEDRVTQLLIRIEERGERQGPPIIWLPVTQRTWSKAEITVLIASFSVPHPFWNQFTASPQASSRKCKPIHFAAEETEAQSSMQTPKGTPRKEVEPRLVSLHPYSLTDPPGPALSWSVPCHPHILGRR